MIEPHHDSCDEADDHRHERDGRGSSGSGVALTGTGDVSALIALMPFASALGIRLDGGPAGVTGTMDWATTRCTANGVLHGGALMTLADTVAATCAYLNLPPGARTTITIEAKTNFIHSVATGSVTAGARPLSVGRRVIVVQTELHDDRDRLVAMALQTQVVLT